MKKVLITGSDGFVGQHLIKLLGDYEVVGFYKEAEPSHKQENLRYVQADITQKQQMDQIMAEEKPDVIVHLAAVATTWSNDPHDIFTVNFDATLYLYEAISKLTQDRDYNPKILFASSGTIYGLAKNPESVDEDSLLQPLNFYATSKACADRLSYQYAKSNNLNIAIVRAFNFAGPGQNVGFFIPDMCSQIAKLEKEDSNELMVGNTDTTRDFLDVRDAVEGYKQLIEKDFENGESFNLCSGKGVEIQQVLDLLVGMSTKQLVVKTDPEKVKRSESPIFVGNNSKFEQFSGWKPQIPLEQTLKDTLEFWRNK